MSDERHQVLVLPGGWVCHVSGTSHLFEVSRGPWRESEGVGVCRVKLHPEFMSGLFIDAVCDASGAVVLSSGALSDISMCRVRCLVVHSVFFFLR